MLLYLSSTLLILLLFIKKFRFSMGVYPIVFVLLIGQLAFLYREYQKKSNETFDEPLIHTLDIDGLKTIYRTPLKMKQEIEPSLNAFVSSTKANDDTVFLNSQKKKYVDKELRKTWRQVDYLLEKIKSFSPKIYATIVPKLTQEQIQKDQAEEEKEELVDGTENGGVTDPEAVRKERERKDNEKRIKKELIEEQRL